MQKFWIIYKFFSPATSIIGGLLAVVGLTMQFYEWGSFLYLHPQLWVIVGATLFFISVIGILWGQARELQDIKKRHTDDIQLIRKELGQKRALKYLQYAEAVKVFNNYHDAVCDLEIPIESTRKEKVAIVGNLYGEAMKFYNAFKKELGLQYTNDELAWQPQIKDLDPLIFKIREVIKRFRELRDREELNPNYETNS